jgi:hypothetical protein
VSGKPPIINGLPPGAHRILIEPEDASRQTFGEGRVCFVIPGAM